jgi:hypothetical protein
MKILPVGAELICADRRTDTTKLIVAFRKFANAPKRIKRTSEYMLHVLQHICAHKQLQGDQ